MTVAELSNELFQTFANSVGNTPLIKVLGDPSHGTIWAKCEWTNPTGSVKDRAALAMMSEVLRDQTADLNNLKILEYSGGNLGLSLATICNMLGIKLKLVLSESSNPSLLERLTELNVDIELVDRKYGFIGVINHAVKLASENPDYTFLYQHQNRANPEAHARQTGKEIIDQLADKRIDAWVAAVGSGGTLSGVYDALSKVNPLVELHMVMPKEMPYGTPLSPQPGKRFAGSGGLGYAIKQRFVEERELKITNVWMYSYEETLLEMKRLHRDSGIKIGTSAAANLLAAREVAKRLGPSSNIVTIFPDRGSPEEWNDALRL